MFFTDRFKPDKEAKFTVSPGSEFIIQHSCKLRATFVACEAVLFVIGVQTER